MITTKGFEKLNNKLDQIPKRLRSEAVSIFGEPAAEMIEMIKKKTSAISVTGTLEKSTAVQLTLPQMGLSGFSINVEIGQFAEYAFARERGAGPRIVPIADLEAWASARFDGINATRIAYIMQRKIAEEGTKPHPLVEPILQAELPKYYQEVYQKVLEVFNG